MARDSYQTALTATPHAVIYQPQHKRAWQVVNLATDRLIGSYDSEERAEEVAAIGSLRGARPGVQVSNVRTGETATLIYVWPGSIEVCSNGRYQRWAFKYTRLLRSTGGITPVAQTPHAIRSLAKKGTAHHE